MLSKKLCLSLCIFTLAHGMENTHKRKRIKVLDTTQTQSETNQKNSSIIKTIKNDQKNYFDSVPDELVILILKQVPQISKDHWEQHRQHYNVLRDYALIMLTCKRFNNLWKDECLDSDKGAKWFAEKYEMPTIHAAVFLNAYPVIQIMIEKDKNAVHEKDFSGHTPLHLATYDSKSLYKIAQLLRSNGADIDAKNMYNVTPYNYAIKHDAIDIARLLKRITPLSVSDWENMTHSKFMGY